MDKATTKEVKDLRFQLAKQRRDKDLGEYKTRLLRYFKEAEGQEEQVYIEKYMETVCNTGLRRLLETHIPPVSTIKTMDEMILYYVEQLWKYIEAMPDAKPKILAGLGGMRYGLG